MKKTAKKTAFTLLLVSLGSTTLAQTVTHTFMPNTPAQAGQVNQNFSDVLNLIAAQNALISDLQAQVAELQQKLHYVSTDTTTNTMVFSGVNVQIQNGMGATNGNSGLAEYIKGPTNGLGNLILGYNEASIRSICSDGTIAVDLSNLAQAQSDCETGGGIWAANQRNGSHNMIIGSRHNYTSHGALIAGHDNSVNNRWGSIVGGNSNIASGAFANISGGLNNIASGAASHISSGYNNQTSGARAAILGGYENLATNTDSTVSGGRQNRASGMRSSVSGGDSNIASNSNSSVSGGRGNIASGFESNISGGLNNRATATYSQVSGGRDNRAISDYSHVSGGRSNQAQGNYSSVSGGLNRSVSGANDWRAGSLFEGS